MALYFGMLFIFILVSGCTFLLIKLIAVAASNPHVQRVLKPRYIYQRKNSFMTKRERDCYKALMQAVGNEYCIFPQAHLTTILDEKIKYENWRAARAHIDRKSIDFVLCDKESMSPKLAIELDDWSHERIDRQERDREVERILQSVGMPLLRILDTENLAEKIAQKLSD